MHKDWQEIAHMSVDAGLCWVGDPCYVLGDDASSKVTDWIDFCNKLHKEEDYSQPLGEGVGVAVSTGYGDGSYPVSIMIDPHSERVMAIRVDFIQEEQEEQEEEEDE